MTNIKSNNSKFGFSLYEMTWLMSISFLSAVMVVLFPEEDVNGINGPILVILYLLDIYLNISCELLIAKQSRWNFIISLAVEITEIITYIIIAARFATLATTLFFWIPIDIISFINWTRHIDKKDDTKTAVRKLTTLQRFISIILVVIWTFAVGYLLSFIDTGTDFFHGDKTLEMIVCYLDACAAALGMLNGIFILLRYEEQWLMWILVAIVNSVIHILSGQQALLILQLGFLTNSIYGLINWNKYIKINNT